MNLKSQLNQFIPEKRILTDLTYRVAFGSDASLYRILPKAVVQPVNNGEIQKLFHFCNSNQIPMTFRAGGTSLSGQALTDGILIDISKNWRRIKPEADDKVRVQPGIIGAIVNETLKPFKRKLGPDPASINACMIGGILANNSSGMCCGVAHNSYHTISSLTVILPNGFVLDTAAENANELFKQAHPDIYEGLLNLKNKIENNAELAEKIRSKYKLKNTTGYSLNAFIDFDTPVKILEHLLIGSEGTLGFIAEAIFNTIPDLPYKYTGLLIFPTIQAASDAVLPLTKAGAAALEIMDRASLASIENAKETPEIAKNCSEKACALLVEYHSENEIDLEKFMTMNEDVCKTFCMEKEPLFTQDATLQAILWKIRKGIFPSVGAVRAQGSAVIIEDVVFPVEKMANGITDLQKLFVKYKYDNAIIFGHAKDGNMHFVITPKLDGEKAIKQYDSFMKDMVELVAKKYKGALKAEHGTGRNIAPFVESEWGGDALKIMEELKALIDPKNILNPGVIITQEEDGHLQNIKSLPAIEEEVDKCMECGFCEPKCPSRDLTLTPRQRIVIRRELERMKKESAYSAELIQLNNEYEYHGKDTCAADGMCATGCPVNINTGDLIKRLRTQSISPIGNRVSKIIAKNFSLAESASKLGIKTGKFFQSIIGKEGIQHASDFMRWLSHEKLPAWNTEMPSPPPNIAATAKEGAKAVYFTTCVARNMGTYDSEKKMNLAAVILTLGERAKTPLYIPENINGKCCGTPFSSKGFKDAYKYSINQLIEQFWLWSNQGELPILIDTSPCTQTIIGSEEYLSSENQKKFKKMHIFDSINFATKYFLPNLKITKLKKKIAIHPVCSVIKMNLQGDLQKIASKCAETATVPINAGCCGFAGDRGLLHPELTASALQTEAEEILTGDFENFYSSSRTCEIGLSSATQKEYKSFLYLLEEASR